MSVRSGSTCRPRGSCALDMHCILRSPFSKSNSLFSFLCASAAGMRSGPAMSAPEAICVILKGHCMISYLASTRFQTSLFYASCVLRMFAMLLPTAAGPAVRYTAIQAHSAPVLKAAADAHCCQTPAPVLGELVDTTLVLQALLSAYSCIQYQTCQEQAHS